VSPRVLRFVYLIVFLFLFNVFAGLLGPGGASVFVAPLLAGISTVAVSYGVRAWLLRRNS
jgi:lipopolysaccharide export LptBFGC system permease protein LptF